MVEEEFGDEDSVLRARAERWNPDYEESRAVRNFVLVAARTIGLPAETIRPYEESPNSDQKLNLIVFQNTSAPASPDQLTDLLNVMKNMRAENDGDGGSEAQPKAQPTQLQPRLSVCFLVGVSPADLHKAKTEEELKELRIVCRPAPTNLDLNLEFFAKGFAASAKKEVDIQYLDEELDTSPGEEEPGID